METSIKYLEINDNKNISNLSPEIMNILHNFCYIQNDNNIIINHYYFKLYSKNNQETYTTLNYLIDQIERVLINYEDFNIHLNIKSLTLIELDKHKELIAMMSLLLKQKFPDKLNNCYIYDAPFIFSSLFSLISSFIDKDTQKKIQLIR